MLEPYENALSRCHDRIAKLAEGIHGAALMADRETDRDDDWTRRPDVAEYLRALLAEVAR